MCHGSFAIRISNMKKIQIPSIWLQIFFLLREKSVLRLELASPPAEKEGAFFTCSLLSKLTEKLLFWVLQSFKKKFILTTLSRQDSDSKSGGLIGGYLRTFPSSFVKHFLEKCKLASSLTSPCYYFE